MFVQPELAVSTPPAHLMTEIPEPVCRAAVNRDLVGCWLNMRAALRRANTNLRALQRWSEAMEGGE